MLRLQVAAPGYLVVKGIVVLLQDVYGLRVGYMGEFRLGHPFKPLQQSLVHKLVEKRHLLRRVFQHIADHML